LVGRQGQSCRWRRCSTSRTASRVVARFEEHTAPRRCVRCWRCHLPLRHVGLRRAHVRLQLTEPRTPAPPLDEGRCWCVASSSTQSALLTTRPRATTTPIAPSRPPMTLWTCATTSWWSLFSDTNEVLGGMLVKERWMVTSPHSRCKVTISVCTGYQSLSQHRAWLC
jgi:hypothetical protein